MLSPKTPGTPSLHAEGRFRCHKKENWDLVVGFVHPQIAKISRVRERKNERRENV
jgi:hypothetical protein